MKKGKHSNVYEKKGASQFREICKTRHNSISYIIIKIIDPNEKTRTGFDSFPVFLVSVEFERKENRGR
jgi:hypothetical protein